MPTGALPNVSSRSRPAAPSLEEHAPLVSLKKLNDDEESDNCTVIDGAQSAYSSSRSTFELVAMTLSLSGLQSAFCAQFSDGTEYLLSIGLSPVSTATVWLAAPVCGAFIQPLIGAYSDQCSSKWGNRKPFIAIGSIGLACSLVALAWASDLARLVDKTCWIQQNTCWVAQATAVLAIILINGFAQAVQIGTRARMVDQCPLDQQLVVNAWATRITSLTNIGFYLLSSTDLSAIIPGTHLQSLMIVNVCLITGATSVTCVAAPRDLLRQSASSPFRRSKSGLNVYIRTMKRRFTKGMMRIQFIQSFSWFAWFPFMFYISSYIVNHGTLPERKSIDANPKHLAKSSSRLGPLALLCQGLVSLVTSFILPRILQSASKYRSKDPQPRPPLGMLAPKNVWAFSQLLYSTSILGILLTDSPEFMIILAAVTGFSWAVTLVVPFAMMGEEITWIDDEQESCSAGMLLGINNVSISLPQVLASIVSIAIFATTSEELPDVPMNSMAKSLAAASITSIVSAAIALWLR